MPCELGDCVAGEPGGAFRSQATGTIPTGRRRRERRYEGRYLPINGFEIHVVPTYVPSFGGTLRRRDALSASDELSVRRSRRQKCARVEARKRRANDDSIASMKQRKYCGSRCPGRARPSAMRALTSGTRGSLSNRRAISGARSAGGSTATHVKRSCFTLLPARPHGWGERAGELLP